MDMSDPVDIVLDGVGDVALDLLEMEDVVEHQNVLAVYFTKDVESLFGILEVFTAQRLHEDRDACFLCQWSEFLQAFHHGFVDLFSRSIHRVEIITDNEVLYTELFRRFNAVLKSLQEGFDLSGGSPELAVLLADRQDVDSCLAAGFGNCIQISAVKVKELDRGKAVFLRKLHGCLQAICIRPDRAVLSRSDKHNICAHTVLHFLCLLL